MALDSGIIRFMRIDARGGSQDLFLRLTYACVNIQYYTGMVCRTRFQDHVFGLFHLAANRAAASTRV